MNKVIIEEEPVTMCFLFPTYGYRSPNEPDGNWLIRVKGRAFSQARPTRVNKLALGLARRVVGVEKQGELYSEFQQRFGLLLDENQTQFQLRVEAIGITLAETMFLDGIHQSKFEQKELVNRFSFSVQNPSNLNPSSNSCTFESLPSLTVGNFNNLNFPSTVIQVKNGHFQSIISVNHSTIQNWLVPNLSRPSLVLRGCDLIHGKSIYGLAQLIEPVGISVISDIDDTIKETGVTRGKKHVFSSTFLYECQEVEGMVDVYKYWALKGACFHYVSNSPWQIFPLLEQFFQKHSFPLGSVHLKFLEPKSHRALFYDSQTTKRESILKLLSDFPKRKFILVGDSGESDLELYTSIARTHPQQIIKIFIRDVFHTLPTHDSSTQHNSHFRFSSNSSLSSISFYKYLFTNSPLPRFHSTPILKLHSNHPSLQSEPALDQLKIQDPLPSSDEVPSTPQLLRTKFLHRFNLATDSLHPQIVTLFTDPHTLLECHTIKLHLNFYPDQHSV